MRQKIIKYLISLGKIFLTAIPIYILSFLLTRYIRFNAGAFMINGDEYDLILNNFDVLLTQLNVLITLIILLLLKKNTKE